MLTGIGKQSGESVESVLKKKRKGYGRKDLQERKVFKPEMKERGGLMDDESSESTSIVMLLAIFVYLSSPFNRVVSCESG